MNKHEWHDKVMTAGIGDAQALAIAGYIAFRYNESAGEAFPSYARIAKDLGIARSTAQAWVAKLEKAGFLEHTRGFSGSANRYMLTTPTPQSDEAGEALAAWSANGPTEPPSVVIQMPTDAEIYAFLREAMAVRDPWGSAA